MLVRGDASWGANYFTTLLGSISGQIALSTLKFAKEPWTSLSCTNKETCKFANDRYTDSVV